jgi:hypothetical protein
LVFGTDKKMNPQEYFADVWFRKLQLVSCTRL